MSTPQSAPAVYAVLTGDIIASSGMSAETLSGVRAGLQEAAEVFCNGYKSSVEARMDRAADIDMYRGDGWQLLLTEQALALRLALFLRATLRAKHGADTRIAIAVGGCDEINGEKLSLSVGEAFTLSGRALEGMTGYFDMTAVLPERAGAMTRWVAASLHLASEIVRGWTRRQSEVAALALLHPNATHEDLSRMLVPPVAKQTVTASLSGAGWRALLEALAAFEETDWQVELAA